MEWISRFEGLEKLEPPVRQRLTERARIVAVAKGARVFGAGKRPENLLLLLSGTVRVQQVSGNGREIVLYRVHAGESCVLTTASLLAYENYSAEGIAETDVQAVAIPRAVFDELIATSKSFRDFVFSAYSRRITDLFYVIDEIAFRRVDIRLAQKLLELQDDSHILRATHQQLAAELGTAREVISRQLQEFQRRGWVELSRGELQVFDEPALTALSTSS
ncbi:MAG: Crp/Fnr family transcriptional regulator [Paracoccaceae bacterium]